MNISKTFGWKFDLVYNVICVRVCYKGFTVGFGFGLGDFGDCPGKQEFTSDRGLVGCRHNSEHLNKSYLWEGALE